MSLRLRPPLISDEAEVLAAQRELESDDFVFAFMHDGQSFADFVQMFEDHRRGRTLQNGWVESTWLVAIVDGALVGRASIRFELNDSLRATTSTATAFRRSAYQPASEPLPAGAWPEDHECPTDDLVVRDRTQRATVL